MSKLNIRKVQVADIPELNKLYRNTILNVNRKDYTSDEVEDWASCADNTTNWHQLLVKQHIVINQSLFRERSRKHPPLASRFYQVE